MVQAKIHEFLNKNYHFTIPNLPRIVCSGLEFLPCFLESVQIDEIRLGNDSLTKFESNDGKLIAGRHIDLIPFGYRESKCEVIRPSVLRCNLGALIAGILHNINTPWRFYWLPGYEETEHVTLCERYSGRLDKLPNNIHVLLIPVPENDELKLLVKVSECGVTIQKFARIDLPQNLQKISDKTCGLSWMCKNCDKSMESWYFRKTLNVD
uniref:Uncharacterized protein n=1 Tax=Caenorhabditis japonica TaxID=281687 RepID=A0A8R1I471_CAEJA